MSGKKTTSPHISQANLLLFELILATAFLSLSSVVCIQLYLKAHTLSSRSAARTHAITESQNIAELWLSGEELSGEIYYDEDWKAMNFHYSADGMDAAVAKAVRSAGGSANPDPPAADRSGASDAASYCMTLDLDTDLGKDGLQALRITVCSLSAGDPSSQLYSLEVERYVP